MTEGFARLAAALADRYRIERELGQGGMATVYLAEDLKHERKVAVKVLRPELAAALGHGRFLREITTTANLRHPHILPLYDSGEAGEFLYYVMPFVEGESLRDRLEREKQLPVDETIRIAREVGDALAYAHDSSVIHRDIKPENILLERGHAVVADFGIARAVTSAGGEKLTQTGLAIGTPLYMSPEQASGVETVDERSDLYSLACVVYEMLAGQPPFTGPSVVAVMARHALDPVPPLRTTRPEVPAQVAQAIETALSKTPAARYPTVSAWREALTGPAARSTAPADSGEVRTDEGFWVAVLPFRYSGADADLTGLAEALPEEIVTGLSRFSYLRVVARGTAQRHAGEAVDVRAAARDLGARYVMEGSLRQAGTRLRVAVQLIDATTGAHLWAENYERSYSPETLFDLQDELVPRIVSTIADMHGVLPRSMGEALRSRSPEQLSPYEAVLRSFAYPQRGTPEELAAARSGLELAVQRAPAHGDAWAMLAFLSIQDYAQGFDLQPDSLQRGLIAARRAVEAAPSSHLAHLSLAQALFFHREFKGFRNAAERAAELNPMDGHSIAFLGELLCYAGDRERGLALAGRAKQLNPHHPGWYWAADFYDAYRRRDYLAALDFALKDNMPGHWAMHAMLAAAYGQLGQREAGAAAVRDLLNVAPGFAASARQRMSRWWEPEYVEHLIDGWRNAGMDVRSDAGPGGSATAGHPSSSARSGAARTDEGFWVAVLPFKCPGADARVAALADELSEGIITGLSRFSYLRVVARGTAQRHASEAVDVRDAARDLGARYVMEGSLRQSGTRLRVAVQLMDATTGATLWAETYERNASPEAAFELQDDLVARVVATCGDRFGVLARSISDAVRGREPGRLGPYEALMRGFGYHHRLTPIEHAGARAALERAVEQAPTNADCWAMLSWVYSHEHAHGFNPRPGSLDRALAAGRRAVDIAPSNQLAQQALAVVLFFRKEVAGCLSAAERAIALNPLDTSNEAIFLITFTGDWERGCALIRRAMDHNPHHPRWYELVLGINEYRLANYRAAVDEVVKANAPDVFWTNVVLAAAYGQLEEITAARAAVQSLLAQKEDFARSGAQLLGLWYEPQLVEHLLEGLRKAGLDIAPADAAPPPAVNSQQPGAPSPARSRPASSTSDD